MLICLKKAFLTDGWSRVHILVRQDFLDLSRLAVQPTQSLAQWVPDIFLRVKWLVQGFDSSRHSSIGIENGYSCTATSSLVPAGCVVGQPFSFMVGDYSLTL